MNLRHITMALAAMVIGVCGAAEAQTQTTGTSVEPVASQAPAMPETMTPDGFYAGVGWATILADDGLGGTAVLGAIQGRVGFAFNANFAVEVEGAIGVLPQEIDFGFTTVDLNLDSEVGVFGVLRAPVSPSIDVYARAGYAQTTISASAGGFTEAGDSSGLAYGVGLEWRSTPTLGSRLELSNYTFDGGGDAFAFQTTIVGYF